MAKNKAHPIGSHSGLGILLVGSIVEFSVAVDSCRKTECGSRDSFAVAAGIVSAILCLIQVTIDQRRTTNT